MARLTRYANHPMVKYVRSMDGEFYLAREVAQMLGCSVAMLVYVRRHSPTPLGATHKAAYGGTVLHLYTRERVEQIAAYMNEISGAEVGMKRRGPVRLWTRTETAARRRAFNRARTYRNRATAYDEQGLAAQAADLHKRAAKVLAELDRARLVRSRKVHGAGRK